MASPDRSIEHAGVKGRGSKADIRAMSANRRRRARDSTKWTWGAAEIARDGDMTVEVDAATEADAWNLSIDIPSCYISVLIEGRKQLAQLLGFLDMVRPDHPLGPFGEFRIPRSSTTWVWDNETPGRLFLWLNQTGKHRIRAELSQQQISCIRSALVEATKPN